MKSEFLNRIEKKYYFEQIKSAIKDVEQSSRVITCSPLHGVSKSLLVISLFNIQNQIMLLMPDSKAVEEINVELNILGLGEWLIVIDDFAPKTIQEKLTKLSKLKKAVLISTHNILTLKFPDKNELEKTTTIIQIGEKITYDELIEYLNTINYQREKFVEVPGEFSVRGSIIDFWSYSEHNPVRLEYDGDFLESIRYFDPESQRSIEKTESVSLSGAIDNKEQLTSSIFDYMDKPVILASSFEMQNLAVKPVDYLGEERQIQKKSVLKEEADIDENFPEPDQEPPSARTSHGTWNP